jgi:hypothetical protein
METRLRLAVAALAALLVAPVLALAGEQAAPPSGMPGMPEMSAEEMAMMQACMEAGTPGTMHQKLEPFVGKWTTANKHWMSPDAPAMEMTGQSEIRWILGGRYLQQTYRGDMMGQPFEGHGLTGYDNVMKRYIGLWIDSMGTAFMTSTGSVDDAGKVFTFQAEYPDAVSGKMHQFREVITVESNDKHAMLMYGPDPKTGKEYKMMEIVYTRAGAEAQF